MMWTLPAVVCGFLLDLLFGDPRWLYHPVRVIGNGISLLEKGLRKIFPKTKAGERMGGAILVILIVTFSAGIPCLILLVAYRYKIWLGFVLESFMCYQLLATRSLRDESKKVYDALYAYRFDIKNDKNYVLKRKISEIIKPNILVTESTVRLGDLCELLAEKNIGGVPVVDDDQLVGIVTERDILNTVLKE